MKSSIVDVLVKVGDKVEIDTPLVTLETDKATMDVPSTAAGTIVEVLVAEGRQDRQGWIDRARGRQCRRAGRCQQARGRARSGEAGGAGARCVKRLKALRHRGPRPRPRRRPNLPVRSSPTSRMIARPNYWCWARAPAGTRRRSAPRISASRSRSSNAGPCWAASASTWAAFPPRRCCTRPRSSTKSVRWRITAWNSARRRSICAKLLAWKNSVVKKLVGGLSALAKQRKVEVVTGVAKFASPHVMEVTGSDGKVQKIRFEQCIIAAGSEPIKLPFIPDDPRVIDSTGALELGGVPQRLLVIGGGIIGLEMATVYASLGAKLSVVELTGQLMPGADPDLVQAAREAPQGALRADPAEHQGGRLRGEARRARDHFRRRQWPAQGHLRPRARGRGPHRQWQADRSRERGHRCQRPGRHPGGQADAHQPAACVRHRRSRARPDAGPQGHARGQGGGRSGRRPQELTSMRA